MGKTLVNIISHQAIPNYLFIKEFYKEEDGDKLLFFTTKSMESAYGKLKASLNIQDDNIEECKISNEESWETMCREISEKISLDCNYYVNLTGGTKYLSLAVQRLFENKNNVSFFYLPYPKNIFLKHITSEEVIPIKHRVTIGDYMNMHGVKYKSNSPIRDENSTQKFYKWFVDKDETYDFVLDQLREHRRKGVTNIEKLEQGSYVINQGKKHEKRYDAIPNIRKFIEASGFVLSKENELTDEEVKYLTGGWFEEYVYNEIKEQIKPDDILIGVDINQTKETNNNDLDVVFTKGNKLFVIECKTGIHKIEFKGGNSNKSIVLKGEEAMFKEIAYKAASIKATLLRLPGNSFICSLSDGNEKFKQSAKNMGIDYYDRSYFTKIEKWKEFIADINRIAKD